MPHQVCRISKWVHLGQVTIHFLHQWCGKQEFDHRDQRYSFGTDNIGSEMNLLMKPNFLDPKGLKKKHIEWVLANYSHRTNLGVCQLSLSAHDYDDWTTMEFLLLENLNYTEWTDESTAKDKYSVQLEREKRLYFLGITLFAQIIKNSYPEMMVREWVLFIRIVTSSTSLLLRNE